jgi:hypothetical protein
VEIVPPEDVELRKHLVVRTNDLEDFLFESEELQPKESVKELEKSSWWLDWKQKSEEGL